LVVATDIPVIVPRRADGGRRDQLFEFVRNWYAEQGYTVVEGHHNDGLFSRSAAINGALAELDWEVCVIADGDVILGSGDQVDKAVDLATEPRSCRPDRREHLVFVPGNP
jgi:hypothetical protein